MRASYVQLPGQVRSAAAANATRPIVPVTGGYRQVLAYTSLGTSFYDGLQVELKKQFSTHFALLASYTWSHTIDTVEWDGTQQNPNDYSCPVTCEKATSQLNQTNRASLQRNLPVPIRLHPRRIRLPGIGLSLQRPDRASTTMATATTPTAR